VSLLMARPPKAAAATDRPPAPDLVPLAAEVAGLYAGASQFSRNFVRGKLLTDPATPAILRLATAAGGFGEITDLGCGRGQVGLALLMAGLAERVQGLDLDPGKVRDANGAAAGLAASFAVADLGQAEVPACDTALIFDVLLQMPERAQRPLLARMAAAARRRVVIRAFDPDCGWRARLGFAAEQVGRVLRRDGTVLRPLPLRDLAAPFEAAGFEVSVTPCWGWTPLPNVMLVAERSAR
jgi:SAM-dependent methyltransferase